MSKYYAVKVGKVPGIYPDWESCKEQVSGFSGAEFKKCSTLQDAEDYLRPNRLVNRTPEDTDAFPHGYSAYVDGSFDKNSKRFSCGIVILDNEIGNIVATHSSASANPDLISMRNVAGELSGAMKAIQWALNHNVKELYIFHDYEGIHAWADGTWKAKLPATQKYVDFVAKARESLSISFIKVRAHSGDKYNNMADSLAKAALGKRERKDI